MPWVDWRTQPIAMKTAKNVTTNYHEIEFAGEHKLKSEALVDCVSAGLLCRPYYAQKDGLNIPYEKRFDSAPRTVLLRRTVVARLKRVDQSLKPYALRLCLLDGYRRIETQREIWNFFTKQIKAQNPTWNRDQIVEEAAHYASDPRKFDLKDCSTWPVHCTGGAVDLTLASRRTSESLYMGGIFDDTHKVSWTTHYEYRSNLRRGCGSDITAQRHRRLLYHAMTAQGFENYPREWWHYDWGDQMWAQRASSTRQAEKAFYGFVQL